jgi:CBS domain containing-hemolysin-like protein
LNARGTEKLFEKEMKSLLIVFVLKALILLSAWFDTFPWGNPLTPVLVLLLVVVIVFMILIFVDTIPHNEFDC